MHQAQFVWESLARVEPSKSSDVIAAKTGVGIDRLGNIAYEAQIFAGTDDKVGAGLMECVEAGEVQVATIHDVKGSRFDHQRIQCVDVVAAPVISIKEGIGPRRSSRVWSLIAALVERKRAHGKRFKQRSMVVESSAYTLCCSSTSICSPE